MSGIGAQMLTHMVRRHVNKYPEASFSASFTNFDVVTEEPNYNLELGNGSMALLVLIITVTALILVSVDYTIGSVIATLCMIESPSTTTIIDAAPPPAYTDEPVVDTKKTTNAIDVELNNAEVLVVANKPITSSIRGSVRHLRSIGGFFARWRGFFIGLFYHVVISCFTIIFASVCRILTGHLVAQVLGSLLAVVATSRLHMLWTHSMIATPTSTRWYRRFVPIKQAKAVLLPSAVYSIARQMVVFVPLAVAEVLGLFNGVSLKNEDLERLSGLAGFLLFLKALIVPATMLILVLFVYLPAAATLTRVEACLLPENQQTIVPFDREAIMGDIDLSQRGSSKQIFRSAWKSFTNSARLRLVKLYLKLAAFQFVVVLVGIHLIVAVLFVAHQNQPSKGPKNNM